MCKLCATLGAPSWDRGSLLMSDYAPKVTPEKSAAVTEIKERLGRSAAVVLTEYRGLTVGELATLRTELAKADVEYRVVKNTLAAIASAELQLAVPQELFEGPTAVAYCFGDPVKAAKTLADFAKDHAALVVKGGILGDKAMSAAETEALAKVDPLEVSLAKICGSLTSPLAAIVGTLEAPLSMIVYVLEQVAARGETAA
jgi:large subunit ribosomal protein L10